MFIKYIHKDTISNNRYLALSFEVNAMQKEESGDGGRQHYERSVEYCLGA